MSRNNKSTRRSVLSSIAAAGAVGLAGCSSSTGSPATKTTTSTTNATTTARTTTTAEPPAKAETAVLENFEQLSDWTVQSGSLTGDPRQAYTGSQAARLEKQNGPVRITRSVDLDLSDSNLSMAFRMQAQGNAVVELKLHAPDANNLLTLSEGVREESSQNWFRIDAGASSVSGLPELENVQKIEIQIRMGGQNPTFWIDDLRRVPSPDDGYAVIFLDDGRSSAYTDAYPVLSENAMPATLSTITERVGQQGYASLDQLDELASNGWDIASHTATHTNLENISRLTAEQEIVNAKQWLLDHGFKTGARWLVYPYGGFSESVTDFARDYHDLGFRYMGTNSCGSGPITQGMTASRGDATDIDVAKKMVDLGDLYNDIEIFTFHEVGGNGQGLSVTRSEFEEFVTYLRKSPLKVVTPEVLYEDFRAKAPADD